MVELVMSIVNMYGLSGLAILVDVLGLAHDIQFMRWQWLALSQHTIKDKLGSVAFLRIKRFIQIFCTTTCCLCHIS